MASRLDSVYRSILFSKFFTKGWGSPKNIKRLFEFRKYLSNRETCCNLVPKDYPVTIDKVEDHSTHLQMSGHFQTPLVHYLPEVIPAEAQTATFQVLLPKAWPNPDLRPLVIHLAGTGDHFFWRRRTLMARPLLKEAGVGAILLENPFYGTRKPKSQIRSSLHNVSDIFVMGACLCLECIALLRWSMSQGMGPLGLTGISMGGHMASIAGCNWEHPVSLVPCLSWTTASCVFTQGVLSGAIPWNLLQSQYFSDHMYQRDISQMIHEPNQNAAFKAGYHFSSLQSKSNILDPESSLEQLTEALAAVENIKGDLNLQAMNFMRGIMDECTHLGGFPCPVDPELAIVVAARKDGYVPRENIDSLHDLWPGSEVRYLDCGHIAAFLFNQDCFRKSILDSLEKHAVKYYRKSLFRR